MRRSCAALLLEDLDQQTEGKLAQPLSQRSQLFVLGTRASPSPTRAARAATCLHVRGEHETDLRGDGRARCE